MLTGTEYGLDLPSADKIIFAVALYKWIRVLNSFNGRGLKGLCFLKFER